MRILGIETSCDETAIAVIEALGSKTKPRIKILSNIISSQVKLHAKFGGVVPNLARREHEHNLVRILLQALRDSRLLELRSMNHESRGRSRRKIYNSKFTILNSILEREPELFARLAAAFGPVATHLGEAGEPRLGREALAKRARIVPKVLPFKSPPIEAIAVTVGPGLAPALWVGVNFARALAFLWKKPIIPVNHLEGHILTNLISPVRENSKHEIRNPKK